MSDANPAFHLAIRGCLLLLLLEHLRRRLVDWCGGDSGFSRSLQFQGSLNEVQAVGTYPDLGRAFRLLIGRVMSLGTHLEVKQASVGVAKDEDLGWGKMGMCKSHLRPLADQNMAV